MKKVALTRELLSRLKKHGYRYLLITDAKIICPETMLYTMTLKPNRMIPACQSFSCTGIDDPLVMNAVDNTRADCPIFVELPE